MTPQGSPRANAPDPARNKPRGFMGARQEVVLYKDPRRCAFVTTKAQRRRIFFEKIAHETGPET